MRTTLGSLPRLMIAALCLCCGLWGSSSARAQDQSDQSAPSEEMTAIKKLDEKVDKLTKAQEEAKAKPPEFRFQWFSYHGARLETTSEKPQSYQAEIWPASGGGPSENLGTLNTEAAVRTARKSLEGNCEKDSKSVPLWIGRLEATAGGSSTSIDPICDDALGRVMRQNGWVTVYYSDGTVSSVNAQAAPAEVVYHQAAVNAIERSTLAVDLGTVFSLQNDGSWKTKPEIAIAAASRWKMNFSGFVDLRYSYTAAKAKDPSPTDATGGTEATDPAPAADENPFASSGGTFRGNIYAAYLPRSTPSFGLIGGAGFSTVPNAPTVEAPLRFFAGARFEVFAYNTQRSKDFFGNASGFFQFGYARDRSWEFDEAVTDASGATSTMHHDEQNRIWVEGQIKFSDAKASAVVYSARVFGDFPTNNKGTSDLRFSVLATVMVQRLLGFTTPPKG